MADRKGSALSEMEDRMSVRSGAEVWEKSASIDARSRCEVGLHGWR